jgi:hypothetical protein
MHPLEKNLRRLRLRLAVVLALRKATTLLALWCFAWGTGVVVLRVAAAFSSWQLLWGAAALPFVVLIAVVLALREVPSATALRAVLDRAAGCGGLLMAAGERPLGAWTLPAAADVRLRWRAGRASAVLGSGVLFVLVGLLLPQRAIDAATARALEIGKEADKLAGQIELLKEEKVLEPARADSLKEKLTQVKEEAAGTNPVKTLEALDHLQNLLNKEAERAAENSVPKAEQLAQAEALAEALRQTEGALDPKVRAEALAELTALAQKAALEAGLLDSHLDAETLKALRAGTLSPEEMRKLAEALKAGKKDLVRKLQKLCDAKLIDPKLLRECEGACACDGKTLAELLKKCGGKKSVRALCKECRPGRGGVSEGPGAAELAFGTGTSEEDAKFKEQVLPPAALSELKKSQVGGVGRDAPGVEAKETARTGALDQAAAGGGSAQTQVVLPRHRAAVERYFARPAAKSGDTGRE